MVWRIRRGQLSVSRISVRYAVDLQPLVSDLQLNPADDKVLLFWDLSPPTEDESLPTSPLPPAGAPLRSSAHSSRPEPLAFAVPYAHPLHSVASHPSTSKELVVSDAQGSVFVVDWRVDLADKNPDERYRGLSIAQLVDPRALADARTGTQTVWGGSVAWQQQDFNMYASPPQKLSVKQD